VSRLFLREEQSTGLVDVDDLADFDTVRPGDMHSENLMHLSAERASRSAARSGTISSARPSLLPGSRCNALC
jgi:hypothetical protein